MRPYAVDRCIDKTSTDTSYPLNAADLEKPPAQNRTVVDADVLTSAQSNTPRA